MIHSESGVAYLSTPRLMTTHETVFSICKEFMTSGLSALKGACLLISSHVDFDAIPSIL